MAPSSPSNSSSSSEESSSPSTANNSSLFLSLSAKPELNSPESESSPIELSASKTTSTTTTPQTLDIHAAEPSTSNTSKSPPSSHDAKQKTGSPLEEHNTKPGNSTVKKTVDPATSVVNSSNHVAQAASSAVVDGSNVIPHSTTTQQSVSTTNTTNTSTTPSKPVLVQSKKAIHPHQPMNAFFPPQLIHHPPHMFDPNAMPYQQPPVRVANANGKPMYPLMPQQAVPGTVPNAHMQYSYSFPTGHPSMVQSQPPTAFYPSPHGSTMVHDANTLYVPMMPPPFVNPNSEVESSEGSESEDSGSDDEEQGGYTIITMQKPSPYSEMKKKYEDLMKLYTKACRDLTNVQTELAELKRKRETNVRGLPSSSSTTAMSPATKKKKTESPLHENIRRTDLIPLGVDKIGNIQRTSYQQLESSITSLPQGMTVVPSSPSSDSSSSVSLNTLVYIYYYDGGCDGHGSRQLKANGKRIFIDINWDEIFKFRKDDCLHMCIFVNTSTVDKVKDSDLIATFKILRSDGDKVKISKIRENLRRLNLQNQFSHIGHIKFFIQIRGSDQAFDYTDKILLYSKTQHNIANFEPSNQKEYNELSKLFYQPERFTVFKKV